MRIGILGTGTVGQTLSSALSARGHQVMVGSRTAPPATFADAASFGELVFNCTAGVHSLEALRQAGAESIAGKVVVDVANPLDFSQGFPPQLSVPEDDSLAEQIQREFPRSKVVKTLNTVTASVMVDPGRLAEPTDLFIAGGDEGAKADVTVLLAEFGWSRDRVRDLGGLEAARVSERYLLMWLALMGLLGSAEFNVRVVGVDTTP
jgi:8-hydroxy-5-deazaflavin:NADPH oxidoreductase